MRAVEVFHFSFVPEWEAADYFFTGAFYESAPYYSERKRHFPYVLLPGTIGEAAASQAASAKSFLLWNPLFASV